MNKTLTELDTFTRAYIACALWSSTDNADDSGGEPLDKNYSESDLAPETFAQMVEDCAAFQSKNDLDGYGDEHAGHDFWLTRNGHGCGFWEEDHGTPEQCALLDKTSKAFGSYDLYVGDDGRIYGN